MMTGLGWNAAQRLAPRLLQNQSAQDRGPSRVLQNDPSRGSGTGSAQLGPRCTVAESDPRERAEPVCEQDGLRTLALAVADDVARNDRLENSSSHRG